MTKASGKTGATVAPERRRGGIRLQFRGRLLCRRAGEREALFLALICALDMYSTVWWVVTGQATEANPLLAPAFQAHPVLFVLLKSLLCLPALLVAPRLAQRRPQFTIRLLRLVTAAYLLIYAGGVLTPLLR